MTTGHHHAVSEFASAIDEAIRQVATSRARYFEHAPGGPLAEACRQACQLGFLNQVGNGIVEMTDAGRKYIEHADWLMRLQLTLQAAHDPVYEDLVETADCGAFDGGCVCVAQALQQVIGGEIAVLINTRNKADHAVVHVNGVLVDFDGPLPPSDLIERFSLNEGVAIKGWRPMRKGDLPGAFRDDDLVDRMRAILQQAFDGEMQPEPLPCGPMG